VNIQLPRVKRIGPGFLHEVQRAAIIRVLKESEGSAELAAIRLNIGKSTMYRHIAQHKITESERY
jgi:transcriptional regulator of acetoin/glycerol metabolism